MKRLLTIGHSYVVSMNRRLAHELAVAGDGAWSVTAAAPDFYHGDLRSLKLESAAAERCEVVPIGVRWSRSPHAMHYQRSLKTLLQQPWDLVHCWEEPFVAAGGQVASWTPRRTPLVFATFQNLPKRYPPPFGAIERFAMRRAAGWIAFGRTVERALVSRPGYDIAHDVIAPGVDTRAFTPDPRARAEMRARLGWTDTDLVVGYTGRFVPAKGLRTLMRALDALSGDWNALFVGGGVLEPELRAWSRQYGDRVRIVTSVTHDEVPNYMRVLDVLCAPSLTTNSWREQLGRVLLEAFASGVPVVGSDSGEIPHVLNGHGIVVPEGDVAALANALDRLLADPQRRHELGANSARRARQELGWDVAARRHLTFFDTLLKDGPAVNA